MVLILKKTSKNYIIMDEYDKQVQEFLDKTKTEIKKYCRQAGHCTTNVKLKNKSLKYGKC